jgi:ribonuclease P protein component
MQDGTVSDQRFFPAYRIRHGADFRRAYQARRSVADDHLVLFGYANGLAYSRLGISASRRLGNAVLRNRWKRLLREAFRQTLARLPRGIDFIVVPRPGRSPTLAALLKSLPRLAGRVAKKT